MLPIIKETFGAAPPRSRRLFRAFGLGESSIAGVIERETVGLEVDISYRAIFPMVEVIFKSDGGADELEALFNRCADSVGRDKIFSYENQILDEVVHHQLIASKKTIATAESCTGGLLGSYLTKHSGSSEYFLGGFKAYSDESKVKLLAVSPERE